MSCSGATWAQAGGMWRGKKTPLVDYALGLQPPPEMVGGFMILSYKSLIKIHGFSRIQAWALACKEVQVTEATFRIS